MLDEVLFAAEWQLGIQRMEKTEDSITIWIGGVRQSAACPACGLESDRVHSVYHRYPADLPLVGQVVRLCAQVRRFFCDNSGCERRTFAEQFPGFLAVKAQRTARLMAHQRAIGLALGGEAGRRLCSVLGMPISGDSLIRGIRQIPEPVVGTPRVLGIDDWAKRKGQDYGTILVDLEAQAPVDVLDSRTAEAVARWLKAHPGVDIVSRDRAGEYRKGISDGAPGAEQVADRWHLLSNLREALVTLLEKKPTALQAAAQVPAAEEAPLVAPETTPGSGEPGSGASEPQVVTVSNPAPTATAPAILTQAQQDKIARHQRRQARFEQAHAVYEATGSMRAVARQLKMSRRVVKRYLNAEHCPQYPQGRLRRSKLTPYLKSLENRWQAGCTNASQLWRDLCQEGFTGSRGLVARWAAQQRQHLPAPLRYRRQQAAAIQATLTVTPPVIPWSAQRASWLIVKKPPDLQQDDKQALHRLLQADPQVALAVDLARQFMTMVRQRQPDRLDPWLEVATTSGMPALISFANGLRNDLAAVRNALRYAWSQGQTEGQVNRLKFIKRSMYGRAKFDLLRKRVLARSAPT